MSDIKREKVDTIDIELGMYVTELDRPWEGTPFLMQGFVLDSDEQIAALKNLCQFIFVDRTKSIGKHFGAQAKHNVAIKRDGSVVRITEKSTETIQTEIKKIATAISAPKVMVKTADNKNKTLKDSSFLDILTAIKNKTSHKQKMASFLMCVLSAILLTPQSPIARRHKNTMNLTLPVMRLDF